MLTTDPKARAKLIAQRFEAIIADEIAATQAAAEAAAKQARRERTVMSACHRLGNAVDRLEQVRHTAEEIPARRALELAARHLRNAMNRSKRYARK